MSRCVRPVEIMLKEWLQAEASEWRPAHAVVDALNVLRFYRRQRTNRLHANANKKLRYGVNLYK